jgi:hypothetical protein
MLGFIYTNYTDYTLPSKLEYGTYMYVTFYSNKLTNHTSPSKLKSGTYRNGTKVRASNFYYVTQPIKSVQDADKGLSLQYELVQHANKTLYSPLKTCITFQSSVI